MVPPLTANQQRCKRGRDMDQAHASITSPVMTRLPRRKLGKPRKRASFARLLAIAALVADKVQLQQLLLNLVMNAIEAMNDVEDEADDSEDVFGTEP